MAESKGLKSSKGKLMADFTKEELLKIAELSALKLNEKDTEYFWQQIKQVIDYVNLIQQVEVKTEAAKTCSVNYFREDKAISGESADVLNQAPKKDGNYFVVPKILD